MMHALLVHHFVQAPWVYLLANFSPLKDLFNGLALIKQLGQSTFSVNEF